MLINLADIISVVGKVEHIQAPIELDCFCLEGVSYPFSKKSALDLTLTHLGERKVRVLGEAKASLLIPCNRCLEDVETLFELKILKDLDLNHRSEDRIKDLDEVNYLDEYNLDVDILVYNELLIDFPMKVLCDKDCKGLCKSCGTNLNIESCNCVEPDPDPRMSAIRDIFKNFKEV